MPQPFLLQKVNFCNFSKKSRFIFSFMAIFIANFHHVFRHFV